MRDAGCEMRDARCEMRDAGCEMRDARCEIRCAWVSDPALPRDRRSHNAQETFGRRLRRGRETCAERSALFYDIAGTALRLFAAYRLLCVCRDTGPVVGTEWRER